MNQGAFLMKGLDNVRAEFSLTALVYNLRRALNILGVEAMMAAVAGVKTPQIAPDRAARAASGRSRKLKRGQEPILAGNGERPASPPRRPASSNPPPFPHGLLNLCTPKQELPNAC